MRCIVLLQIIWFSLNCLGRAVQHLAITTLELTTLGFIICTLGTFFFWAHKPMDVSRPITLNSHSTIVEIILRAGDAVKKPYKDTPLDFVGIERWSWCLYWSYWMNILRKFKIVFATKKRPLDKVPDDNFLPPSRGALIVLFLIHAMYGTVLLCGWNFTFPTSIEQILWRIAILTVMATIILSWAIDRYTFYLHPIFKQYWYRCWPMCGPKSQAEERPKSMIIGFLDSLRNNSPGRGPDLYVPLKACCQLQLRELVIAWRGAILYSKI